MAQDWYLIDSSVRSTEQSAKTCAKAYKIVYPKAEVIVKQIQSGTHKGKYGVYKH